MAEKTVVHQIVDRHWVAFDPDRTFKENCLDSMTLAAVMVDIENELGVDVMILADRPEPLPATVQELEVAVLEMMQAQSLAKLTRKGAPDE
jgi:hypothetical protein